MANGGDVKPAFCEFPEWLHGHFSKGMMQIGRHLIEQGANGGGGRPEPDAVRDRIHSRCVHGMGEERFLVHSEGKCGRQIGFHCLWFRARSSAVIEFRTTGLLSAPDADQCESGDNFSPWIALVSDLSPGNNPLTNSLMRTHCGLRGHFGTPKLFRPASDHCFWLDAGCDLPGQLRLVASHCSSGHVFEVSEFECLASWREGSDSGGYLLFTFTRRLGPRPLSNSTPMADDGLLCFVSRESVGPGAKGVELVPLGENCRRQQIDWGERAIPLAKIELSEAEMESRDGRKGTNGADEAQEFPETLGTSGAGVMSAADDDPPAEGTLEANVQEQLLVAKDALPQQQKDIRRYRPKQRVQQQQNESGAAATFAIGIRLFACQAIALALILLTF